MAKGQQQAPTQTTEQILSPEQREVMNLAMPGVRQFAAQTPERYRGPTTAGFNPTQVQAQNMALGAASGPQQQLADAGTAATSAWLWESPDARRDDAIAAATRPIQTNLTESTLPALRNEFVNTGFGSSRQGIAEGLASGRASQAIGDTGAKMSADIYSTDVNAQLKALGLLPQTQAAAMAPALATSAVGDVRQALEQRGLDEASQNFYFEQYAPFLQSKEIMALLQGFPGGGTKSTGSVPQANPVTQGLGGALAGAQLGSMFMPGAGTAVGAGAGALLPFLFS